MTQPQLSPPAGQMSAAVLASPNLALIFWGQFWANHPDFMEAGTTFFIEFLRGHNIDRLAQYGVNIGQVCCVCNVTQPWIKASDGGMDIANSLGQAIQSGLLPQPTAYPNMVYVFVQDPTVTGAFVPTGQGLGAQHWLSTNVQNYPTDGVKFLFLFSDLPQAYAETATAPGIGGSTWWKQAGVYTALLSHEMYETFTDPVPYTGWSYTGSDPATNPPNQIVTSECCDICDDQLNGGAVNVESYGPWSIDYYWSNKDSQCVLGYQNNWVSLGSPPGANGYIAAAQNQNGSWELFTITPGGDLWNYTGSTAGQPGGSWKGGTWNVLVKGAALSSFVVTAMDVTLGLIEVLAINKRGELWHVYQTASNGPWMAGEVLGAPDNVALVPDVAVGQNAPNPNESGYRALEAFVVGSDNQLHHIWQLGPWKGWSGWGDSLGAPPPGTAGEYSGPCVASNADGRLEVFLLGGDKNIWHIWQTAPNSGWSGWSSLPLNTQDGAVIRPLPGSWQCGQNKDGRIEIFVVGPDRNLSWNVYHICQTAPNNGWSEWQILMPLNVPQAVGFQGFPSVANNLTDYQELQVCTIATDEALWTVNQVSPPGQGWNQWRFLGSPSKVPLDPLQSPTIAATTNGLTVFVYGGDSNIWSISQINPGGPWGQLLSKSP